MTSVSERLHPKFKFVFTSGLTDPVLQLRGPIVTLDQLDAVVEVLDTMRDWLAAVSQDDANPSQDQSHDQ